MANAHTVNMSTFEKAQDDSCTSQVLLHLCGHSYLRCTKLMGLHSRGSVRIVPLCVRFFLTCLAQQIALSSLRSRSGDEPVGFGTPRGRSNIGTSHRDRPLAAPIKQGRLSRYVDLSVVQTRDQPAGLGSLDQNESVLRSRPGISQNTNPGASYAD